MGFRFPLLLAALGFLSSSVLATGDETPKEDPVAGDDATAGEEDDETTALIKKLTIGMVHDIVDERTVEIRDSSKEKGKRVFHLRLGNVLPPRQGAAHSNEQHAERLAAAKSALTKLVDKHMIWWKAAPEEIQNQIKQVDGKPPVVIGDIWLQGGNHVNSLLAKEGHLEREKHYHEELAKDILGAAAEQAKQESFKELEKALRESERERRKQEAAEAKKEAEKPEPIGIGGWIGLASLGGIIVMAVAFGRGKKKKTNMNRKRGMFEQFWMKLKGA